MAIEEKDDKKLIIGWFEHIAQIANDKKTLNGFVMSDSDAFAEIECLAKRCAEYIKLRVELK